MTYVLLLRYFKKNLVNFRSYIDNEMTHQIKMYSVGRVKGGMYQFAYASF